MLSCNLWAQDERFFRDMFSGELARKKPKLKKKYKWQTNTPFYQFDLDGDKWKESVIFEKRDGEDWLHLHNLYKERIFSYRFDSKGLDSRAVKFSLRSLSSNVKLLVIHYFEGYTSYLNFHGTGRFYFLTVEKGKINSASIFKGPIYWEEFEGRNTHYRIRKSKLGLFDYNTDGVKEVIVKHQLVSTIFGYKGSGNWITY